MTSRPVSRSVYSQIAAELRGQITSGEYPKGSRLPAETELMTRFEVTRPTVNKALQVLREEGLVEVRRGVGTFVSDSTLYVPFPQLLRLLVAHVDAGGALLLRHPDGTIQRVITD